MPKSVFISYCHKQGQWVREKLLPVLRASGCGEVLVDNERFIAGCTIKGQMDSLQDRADTCLLVLTSDYLASDYCRHEMDRALKSDGKLKRGGVLPVVRDHGGERAFTRRKFKDLPLWVDLVDDADSEGWDLLLRSLGGAELGVSATHWLNARDEIVRKVRDRRESLNLIISGQPNWRALIDHLRDDWLPALAVVDLNDPATVTRDGLVRQILSACGSDTSVARPPRDLVALNGLLTREDPVQLALLHFERVRERGETYGRDFFSTLRFLIENRKLLLLAQSRIPFKELLPRDHLLSRLTLGSIQLIGADV